VGRLTPAARATSSCVAFGFKHRASSALARRSADSRCNLDVARHVSFLRSHECHGVAAGGERGHRTGAPTPATRPLELNDMGLVD
jgi:hypothetical protein